MRASDAVAFVHLLPVDGEIDPGAALGLVVRL
jgi:hypothetical protein